MASIPEDFLDLLDANLAEFATVGDDGYPQVSAIWFLGDAGTVRLSLNTTRQKVKNLGRDPKCTLFILDPANPMRYLEIRADAHIADDADYTFADRVGAKYGADLRHMDGPGDTRVVITLVPTHVNAVKLGS